VLVSVDGAVCKTFARIVMKLLDDASIEGSVQLTVCDATEQDHPAPVALVGVRPTGSVSFTVTMALVGP